MVSHLIKRKINTLGYIAHAYTVTPADEFKPLRRWFHMVQDMYWEAGLIDESELPERRDTDPEAVLSDAKRKAAKAIVSQYPPLHVIRLRHNEP